VAGQGGVTGRAVDGIGGKVYPIQGIFAGGPNGAMTITANGETFRTRLSQGRTITAGRSTLTVKNPGAFDKWKDP
jgi:hypothetical protein